MKLLSQPAVAALGLAGIYGLVLTAPLGSPRHDWVYHNSDAPGPAFAAALVNVAIIWFGLTLLLTAVRRQPWTQRLVWAAIILTLPCLLVEEGGRLNLWSPANHAAAALLGIACAAWLGIALGSILRPALIQPPLDRAQRAASGVFSFAAISTLFTLAQMVWCFAEARDSNQSPLLRQRSQAEGQAAATQSARVIWIVLDELSYEQVYERRFPHLQLPAFDRIASQSTVFTHVIPTAISTGLALPSLLTGVPVDELRVTAAGNLVAIHDAEADDWQTFRRQDTIFQAALDAGYSSGIAGWFNPYCRILPGVLDHCYWTFHTTTDPGLLSDVSTGARILAPWAYVYQAAISKLRGSPHQRGEAVRHLSDYRDLVDAGDQLLNDSSCNFVLLHLPIPHPGGIYNRRTGALTTGPGSSYIDNLALADRYLDHVYQLLAGKEEWDSTTIVLMGDHSWRTQMTWMHNPLWTPEDQAASRGGQYDERPVYLVKLPYQETPARIDEPFHALATRALLQQLLRHTIQSPAQLHAFAATWRPAASRH